MLDVLQEANLIRKVTKKVYWNSRFVRLRSQIDEEDLIQMVFYKLLYRENYKKYSDDYSLVGFIYRVANGCAISYATKRCNIQEWTVLDQPMDDSDDSKVLRDYLTSYTPEIDLDLQARVNKVAASMDSNELENIVIRYDDVDTKFSLEALFDFFMETRYTREEMRQHVINKKTKVPVTMMTFNKWWKKMVSTAEKALR